MTDWIVVVEACIHRPEGLWYDIDGQDDRYYYEDSTAGSSISLVFQVALSGGDQDDSAEDLVRTITVGAVDCWDA